MKRILYIFFTVVLMLNYIQLRATDSLSLVTDIRPDSVESTVRAQANIATEPEKEPSVPSPAPLPLAAYGTRQFASLGDFTPLPTFVEEFHPEGLVEYPNSPLDSIRKYTQKALGVIDKVKELGNYVDYLGPQSLVELPVAIRKNIGGLEYMVVISSIKLKPSWAELEAYMVFDLPNNDKRIAFMGRGIKLSFEGGIVGDARLELLGDYAINLNGEKSQIILKGSEFLGDEITSGPTYVSFDCSGFLEMGVGADVKFSRDLLLKENPDGSLSEDHVIGTFQTVVNDWNNLLVEIDLPTFRVTNLKDFSFKVQDAVFDFSDLRNAPAVRFPEDYDLAEEGAENLWRGVYIRELSVTLPPQFKNTENTERTSFSAYDLLIDNQGFSGDFVGRRLISIEKGKIANWAFSLDSIGISLRANTITSAGFNGQMNIPINKEEKYFDYTAIIDPGDIYLFSVENRDDIEFDVWKANVTLYESSYIEIKKEAGDFHALAHLNGKMDVQASLSDNESDAASSEKGVKLAGLQFEALEIQTKAPYVTVGYFSLGTEGKESGMAGFRVNLNEVSGFKTEESLALRVDLTLSLTGKSGNGFGANGAVTLNGNLDTSGERAKWRYSGLNIDKFGIDIDGGAFSFRGQLQIFKNDPVYGRGINGIVDAEFTPGIKVQATALFGNVNGHKYWYADALASFKGGIPIFTGVGIYGFGGGAYYGMKLDTQGNGSELGETVSGVVYVPDTEAGLGLKATVEIGTHPTPEGFNGDATLEMAFYKGGGLRYIAFKGNAYFATPPLPIDLGKLQEKTAKLAKAAKSAYDKANSATKGLLNMVADTDEATEDIYGKLNSGGGKGSISAHLFISYDFENRTLHGNFKAYVNVAGGLIKGGGPDGLAGEIVLHFAPGEWYIYVGRPEYEKRISLEMAKFARVDSYFVMGTTIPGFPPPPDEVAEIIGEIDLDFMKGLNEIGQGAGIGFGASMKFDTGDISFLIFYARFKAGIGFDVMLKNYGDNVRCKGRDKALGINGWYASGQAYAYFEGSVGIKIKLFFKKKKIEIFAGGAAVVLQAALPNPIYMRGVVGGYFRVLGGLVKGKFKVEVEIGEKCDVVGGSVLEGIDVIAQVTPNENEQDVDVFTAPQAVFNYEIGKSFEMVDNDDIKKKFRIKMDEFSLSGDTGPITGTETWNQDNTVVAFNPFDILPPQQEVKMTVQVSFEEQVGASWQKVKVDGQALVEKRTLKFKTGDAPDYIPESNVAYAYPMPNQYNFYKNETGRAYLTLKRGQPYLFEENADFTQIARFASTSGNRYQSELNYNAGSRKVNIPVPSDLPNNNLFNMSLVNLPKSAFKEVDANVSDVTSKVSTKGQTLDTEITQKQAEGSVRALEEKVMYEHHFRSSRFNTFTEKIRSFSPSSGWRYPMLAGVHELGVNINGTEGFDQLEYLGSVDNTVKPLIQIEAVLTNNPWYNQTMAPLIYNNVPFNSSIDITRRNTAVLGKVPTKAVYFNLQPDNIGLTEQDVELGSFQVPSAIGIISYQVNYEMYWDYYDLKNQVARHVANGGKPSTAMNNLLVSTYPVIQGGDYKVDIKYNPPGESTPSSVYQLNINNKFD